MSSGDATELFFALALLAAILLLLVLWRHGASLRRRAASARRLFVPVLAAGALGVFAKIASEVQERETTSFDRAVSLGLHRLDTPAMDAAMRFLTFLGSFPAIAAVVASACVWRLKQRDRRGAAMLAGVTVATELLNLALKETFRRSRPSLFQEIATLHSYSFPSGHAMASAAAYGAVAVLVAREFPARAPIAFAAAAALSLLIGISRIYLGVHWMTDVLAGWAAGVFVLLIGTYLLARSDARGAPA
jgi:undecaprenyl-diphosphatase